MAGLGLANAYGAKAAADELVELIATRQAEQDFRERKARQAQLDAEARDTTAFNRRRLVEQDERQRRLDEAAETDKATTRLMKLAEHFPGARAKRSAFGHVPADLDALILKPLDPTLASRSLTGFASMPGAATREGAMMTDDREAIEPGTVEIQEPESERRRIADTRAAAAAEKGDKDRAAAEQRRIDLEQHRERMAELARLRIDKGGSGNGGVGTSDDDLDALATMIETNPDMLQRLNPTARTKVMTRIATRGGGRMRNERADSMRNMLDTALGTVRKLRGDDDKGTKGKGGKGFEDAVGRKGMSSLWGVLDEPIAGTEAAGYAARVDALRSQLTLPELQKMRGMGALSDREFKTLAAGATTLSRALQEGDFLTELDNIETTIATALGRLPDANLELDEPITVNDPRPRAGSAAKPTRDPSGGLNGMIKPRTVRVQAPNGAIRDVPENEVPMFTAAGGKVVK